MVTIQSVLPNSIAEKKKILPGDLLLSVNGQEISDVLDYRFYMTEEKVNLLLTRDGKAFNVAIKKEEYDDIGLCFATPLMDKKRCCANKCIFCFIDQLPKGMRESLYFKDDDDRLSFLHGNYVTLTNLKDKDIDRIIRMHISPVNISVHTTNPELRVKMMGNKRAGEVLSYLKTLADHDIALCTQIVLCKGWNDGEELKRTMHDLSKYVPALRSCSVVPFGMTKYRENLCPIEDFTREESKKIIETVNAFGDECLKQYETRLFYCSDEFYLKANLPLPDEDFYEDYAQIENGVGMLTSLSNEFDFELQDVNEIVNISPLHREISLATGVGAYPKMKELSEKLMKQVPGLSVAVYPIQNHFFGETVTVAGLLTGKDVGEQLQGKQLGEELLLPAVMLKADEDIFLDDMTPTELSKILGVKITFVPNDGGELLHRMLGV